MSRSNYSEDNSAWELICWRGAVASAIRGKRGQAFLKELLNTLDTMREKRLIRGSLIHSGEVCAMGAVMVARNIDAGQFHSHDSDGIAEALDISDALVREIEYVNDEYANGITSPSVRWKIVRDWVASSIKVGDSGKMET